MGALKDGLSTNFIAEVYRCLACCTKPPWPFLFFLITKSQVVYWLASPTRCCFSFRAVNVCRFLFSHPVQKMCENLRSGGMDVSAKAATHVETLHSHVLCTCCPLVTS